MIFSGMFVAASHLDHTRLLTVSIAKNASWITPEIVRDRALRLPSATKMIDASAAYAWRPSTVRGPEGGERVLSARITPAGFELLGTRARLGRAFRETDLADCQDCVVLSNLLWKSQFRGDDQVIGRRLFLNGRPVRVIGILPRDFRFPGLDISVYRLFGANGSPALPMFEWPGALLRVPPGVDPGAAKREAESWMSGGDGVRANTKLAISSLKDLENQSLKSWARLALLALVLLLALKVWQFARLHLTGPHSSKRQLFRWYLFLAVKTALLLIAALIAALDLVHAAAIGSQSASGYSLAGLAAIWVFLFGANMALTWSIRDQLDRCRVCLKGLGMHVNLGSASHILLESNGTEWMCDEGHGALHLPVMESGSVDSERWSYLDDSWRVLLGNRETRITASS